MKHKILDRAVSFCETLFLRLGLRTFHNSIYRLESRAIEESAIFIEQHLGTASLFTSKKGGIWPFVMKQMIESKTQGLWLEFGVRDGISANFFARYLEDENLRGKVENGCLYGFDKFEGIRNHWSSVNEPNGSFSRDSVVPIEPRYAQWIVGWVEDTLVDFLKCNTGQITFVHFDLDVFEPTLYALEQIAPRLASSAVILFDEFHGYPGWKLFERKALEMVLSSDKYEFIAFARKQAAIRLR